MMMIPLPDAATARKTPLHLELLWGDFDRKRTRNPRFSLRAYSRFLGVDPSSLSRILNEKEEISLSTCITVLRKLTLDDAEKQRFLDSVIEDRRAKMEQVLHQGVFGAPQQRAS